MMAGEQGRPQEPTSGAGFGPSAADPGPVAGEPGGPARTGGPPSGAPGHGGGGGKGLCGCLGCFGVILFAVIVIPVVLAGGAWLMLPTIMSPADTEWQMVQVDPATTQQVEERIQGSMARLNQEGSTTLELTEDELNQILAQGIRELRAQQQALARDPDAGVEEEEMARAAEDTRGRFVIENGVVRLDMVVDIPEQVTGLPGRLRGQTTGMELSLRPRAAGSVVALRVESARIGRIPVPVNMALGLLQRMPVAHEIRWMDPQTREIRVPLEELGNLPQGVNVDRIEAEAGRLVMELSR